MERRARGRSGSIGRVVVAALALVGAVALAAAPAPAGAQAVEPAVVVTPSTGLLDGQTVEVAATGLLPSTTVYIVMCPPGITDGFSCDLLDLTSGVTDAEGALTRSFVVRRDLSRDG